MKILTLLLLSAWAAMGACIPPPNTYDWEAQRWQMQCATNGGTLSLSSYRAGTYFMQQSKRFGIRPLLGRVNLYLGTDTNAMLVPIIRDWWDVADLVDNTDAFVAADWDESLGLTGNTTTKFLRPGSGNLALAAHTGPNDLHLAVYNRTGANSAQLQIGRSGGAGGSTYIAISQVDTLSYLHMGVAPATAADSAGVGFYQSVRSSSTNAKMYKNGAVLISDTNADASSLAGTSPVVHAFNSSGTIAAWTDRTLSYYAFGNAMNDAQALAYYKAVQNVQIALRRQK